MARVIGHDRSLSPFFRLLPSTAVLSFLFNIPSNFLSFHSHRQKNQSSFPRSLQFEQSYAIYEYTSIPNKYRHTGREAWEQKKKRRRKEAFINRLYDRTIMEKRKKKRWGSRFDREGKVIFEICN